MKTLRSLTVAAALTIALASANSAGAQAGNRGALLDPNTVGEKELLALPHMSAALVKTVMDARPFLTMSALDSLLAPSLSKEQRAELYAKTFVQINLNNASKAEIMLIPSMGPRMLREFEEYRPYKSLAQFQREIGKYVKADELARLEQFVFVPIDLNTASDSAIMSIPGLGRRMLREFKEYRPYKSLEQFRREIGKYVDAKEVARLERYVVIN